MYKVLQRGFILSGLIILFCATGCASHSRTVRTDVVTTPEGRVYSSEPVVVEHKTEVVEEKGGCGGLLSCTVDVAGEVVALPFRSVGGVLSAIF
jgi:hypothetical protein